MSEESQRQADDIKVENGIEPNKKKDKKYKIDPTEVTIGDFNIKMNKDIGNIDPLKLLMKMHQLRIDKTLTNEEKAEKLKQMLNEQT
ncbi:MAG: hypothetical protein PWR27_1912 [Petroclostridium sp.]|jgi:hypothetical protein|uniref:hypothetical protein n=1 Tax=Petroclostridium xylanilyticum TaxID=1792311 RepID=UPI000B980479|nr:hypothetical protein [Petroclostridium xylanilyticum]MBZ4645619.1 hypothetical protein [Clostridia bacterium]MDK2811203.1 hypothetical protein [Petroclostridium sp.]